MKEVNQDSKWLPEVTDNLDAVLVSGPTEDGQLAILTMLMRIYDIQMAILNSTNEAVADEIFEAHERGETFNPPLYIPQFGVKTDAEDSD